MLNMSGDMKITHETPFYHGTCRVNILSIATFGLLARECLEKMGRYVCFPDHTKYGSVYLTTDRSEAHGWGGRHRSID
jgi:hypothetical protein